MKLEALKSNLSLSELWIFASLLHDVLGRVQLLGGDAGAKQSSVMWCSRTWLGQSIRRTAWGWAQ